MCDINHAFLKDQWTKEEIKRDTRFAREILGVE